FTRLCAASAMVEASQTSTLAAQSLVKGRIASSPRERLMTSGTTQAPPALVVAKPCHAAALDDNGIGVAHHAGLVFPAIGISPVKPGIKMRKPGLRPGFS